jgi:hypothetical protein
MSRIPSDTDELVFRLISVVNPSTLGEEGIFRGPNKPRVNNYT